jgi:hypothetical protein
MFTLRNAVLVSTVVVGCATVRPEDHTVAEHEAIAAKEEKEAATLSQQCQQGAFADGGVCWTSVMHPSSEQLMRAARDRQMAMEHLAAARALRDAETQACVGIADRDRHQSIFFHREDITGVEELYRSGDISPDAHERIGARVTFRAVPGMTTEWLQRVIDCHQARNAAVGWDMPEMSYCPLALRGAHGTASPTRDGFAISVRSDDPDVVAEIVKRAKALL